MPSVTRNIAADLLDPIRRVVSAPELSETILQILSVPEVTVAKHSNLRVREHNIRPPRKSLDIDLVPSEPNRSKRRA